MLIIGCGNRDCGDDAAGILLVEKLRELGAESLGARLKVCTGEAAELIDIMDADDDVILVDAILSGSSVGTIHTWNAEIPPDATVVSTSTHSFGLTQAIRLMHILGRSPRSLRVFGIEGKTFALGSVASLEVEEAVEALARQINAALQNGGVQRGSA